jgi:hypothetical protein
MQRALHLEAIKAAQDFSVNQHFVDPSNPTTNPETTIPDFVFSKMSCFQTLKNWHILVYRISLIPGETN